VQAQIERVEAARKRMAAQLSELDAHKPAANAGAPGTTPALLAARVQCTGRGTNIVLVRDTGGARVSYDNGPEVQPRISDLGTTPSWSRASSPPTGSPSASPRATAAPRRC